MHLIEEEMVARRLGAAAGMVPMYSAREVREFLDYPGCIDAVGAAMIAMTAGERAQPVREVVEVGPNRLFASMVGSLAVPEGFGAKVVSVFGDENEPGRTRHQGVVVLFDYPDGAPVAMGDAGEITAIRTASASAVATNALARQDARCVALFGCGHEARTHVQALRLVRPIEDILVWGRNPDRASAFAASMTKETGLSVRAVPNPREAAEAADIICTVSGAKTPILLGEWVKPGTHVNAIGSSRPGPVEVDNALVTVSRFVADSRRSVLAGGAEFLVAREAGLIDDSHIVAEIGEVLLGQVQGRLSDDDITFYKSLGHIVQDLAALKYLHERAGHDRQPGG